ncbi:DNA-binding transcriptional regulator, MerR family [Austwickia chelonae]|uniref:Putative MerR family transcriptional regulator n=1 Tax=Austwickia chelonae NBRC 105200 TaxID=1184607 RepID=K6UL19_9MICO|nr:MerR family transcriptional regulator [Austwickia chelonae]GAB76866.1 putative MerR family transcriptional regulator [Austwickia chelonae NBRC 105200]SEW31749.1 DNA-binding transcriptional regulator, MerR family [Austwickia chelonae]
MLTVPGTGPIPSRPLQIGDVAELTGLSLRSIRHYEDLGLVTPEGRTAGGFRIYDAEAIERLRLVMSLKLVGLSLEQIRPIVDACRAIETGQGTQEDASLVQDGEDAVAQAIEEIERILGPSRLLRDRLRAATRDIVHRN